MYSAKGVNLGIGRLQSIDLECCDLYIQRTGQFVRSFIISLFECDKRAGRSALDRPRNAKVEV